MSHHLANVNIQQNLCKAATPKKTKNVYQSKKDSSNEACSIHFCEDHCPFLWDNMEAGSSVFFVLVKSNASVQSLC